jgi:uncharacterized protein (DUF1778 family)
MGQRGGKEIVMTSEATSSARTSRRRSARATVRTKAPGHGRTGKKAKGKAKAKVNAKPERGQAERMVSTKTSSKTPMLSFRMDLETRELVDHAASLAGQNRTDFMVTVLREKAIEVILDRRLFLLNDTDWNAFTKHLDEPPAPNAKLKALLSRTPVWDQ